MHCIAAAMPEQDVQSSCGSCSVTQHPQGSCGFISAAQHSAGSTSSSSTAASASTKVTSSNVEAAQEPSKDLCLGALSLVKAYSPHFIEFRPWERDRKYALLLPKGRQTAHSCRWICEIRDIIPHMSEIIHCVTFPSC